MEGDFTICIVDEGICFALVLFASHPPLCPNILCVKIVHGTRHQWYEVLRLGDRHEAG